IIAIFFAVFSSGDGAQEVSLTRVMQMARQGEVTRITVDGDRLLVDARSGRFVTNMEQGSSISDVLQMAQVDPVDRNIEIVVQQRSGLGNLFGILLQFLPLIFFGAILLFMMRQAQGSNNQA